MIELSPLERIIAKLLVNTAIQRKGNYSYSELADILDKQYGQKVNAHYGLAKPLGDIARICCQMGLPLLSARVQYKNDTAGKTAGGFYDIACELRPSYVSMDPKEVRRIELQATRECTDWSPLLFYLGEETSIQRKTQTEKTVPEQLEEYVRSIIKKHGVGYTVQRQDIVAALASQYGTNPNSVLPADFCYNRWNKGIEEDGVSFFEYVKSGEYRVWGMDYPFNGAVLADPNDGEEHAAGYCVDGHRYIGKLPIYPDEITDQSVVYREGKKAVVQINTYERNPAARVACIKRYGAKCCICGMDFGAFYGPEQEGLIHVHHIRMISQTEGEHMVNPEDDLRPVCPNCHMVLHSKPGGYSIEDVVNMVERRGSRRI